MAQGLSCSMARVIFLDQGSNPCLLLWLAESLPLSLQETLTVDISFEFQSHQAGKLKTQAGFYVTVLGQNSFLSEKLLCLQLFE